MRHQVLVLGLAAGLLLSLPGCPDPSVHGTLVSHTTADGLRLSATYLQPDSASREPVLLLLHEPGPTRSRHDFDSIWDVLAEQGYGLVAADLRSHGDSDSAGAFADLATDPLGYPEDVLAWLDFISDRDEAGDPVDAGRIGIIGLGTSGSLAAAALGKGHGDCAVALSATIFELNSLESGFPVPEEGDDDDDARGESDDDDSAGDDDDDDGDDDDDDSGAVDGEPSGELVSEAVALRTTRWIVGTADEPAASNAQALFDATSGERDLMEIEGDEHGLSLLLRSDDIKLATIEWCGDKL